MSRDSGKKRVDPVSGGRDGAAVGDGSTVSNKRLEPRAYQLDIVDKAKKQNVIACLPTGSGKTFIAILLMKELAQEIEGDFDKGAKRTIFLVPSVALVEQQGEEIRKHTPFSVGKYVGTDGVDTWLQERWHKELSEHQVLVMTAQIMVNILTAGFLQSAVRTGLGCVNLLILDECHHAVKGYPYVQVIRRLKEDTAEIDQPRVFGLSASLVNKSDKSLEKFEARIADLKEMLSAELSTARDMAEVRHYATAPDTVHASYPCQRASGDVVIVLDELAAFIENHPYYSSEKFKSLKNGIKTLALIYEDLGPWATRKVARCIAKELRKACTARYDKHSVYRLSLSRLRLVAEIARKESYDPRTRELVIHSKLRKLKEILVEHEKEMRGQLTEKWLLGIVFVERRYMALALNAVLRQMGKVDQKFGRIVQCNFLTGHGDLDILSKEASMKVKTQCRIISDFAKENINVLVATKVAEEGLDIRKCNLVVRFDRLQEFRGYVQSRGRARDKPSKFVVMSAEGEEKMKADNQLERFDEFEKHLVQCCQDEHHDFLRTLEEDDADDDDSVLLETLNYICPPFYPDPENKALARADTRTSIQIVNLYVSRLCRDGTQLSTHVSYVKAPSEHFFQQCYACTLRLPLCSALPSDDITGVPLPSRRLAKQAACLEVVRRLFAKGELNKHLKPLPVDNFFDEEEFSEDELEDDDSDAQQKDKKKLKAHHRYKVHVPKCFQPPPAADSPLYLHSLEVTPVNAELGLKYQGQYGLLLSHSLDKMPDFSLAHPSGKIRVCVVPRATVTVPAEKKRFVSEFTRFLFLRGVSMPTEKGDLHHHLDFCGLQPDGTDSNGDHGDGVWYAGVVMMTPRSRARDVIDWKAMDRVRDHSHQFHTAWCPAVSAGQVFCSPGAVVEKRRDIPKVAPDSEQGKHEVVCLHHGETARAPCDVNAKETFEQRDIRKGYGPVQHPELPLLGAKRLGMHYEFGRNQMKTGHSKADERRSAVRKLIAEHCNVHVLSSVLLHSASLLPALLTRLFHEQQARELHVFLCSGLATQLLKKEPRATFTTSRTHRDCATTTGLSLGSMLANEALHGLTDTFPDVYRVFESLSRIALRYEVNLERLEMLGDSFLKLATSTHLFCHPKMQSASEGQMTHYRVMMISNNTLYRAARCRGLVPFIFKLCKSFKNDFVPPLCTVSNRQGTIDAAKHTLNELSVKNLADTVEALIAAFLIAGGNDAARHFMLWCGIPYRNLSAKKKKNADSTEADDIDQQEDDEGAGTPTSPALQLTPRPSRIKSTMDVEPRHTAPAAPETPQFYATHTAKQAVHSTPHSQRLSPGSRLTVTLTAGNKQTPSSRTIRLAPTWSSLTSSSDFTDGDLSASVVSPIAARLNSCRLSPIAGSGLSPRREPFQPDVSAAMDNLSFVSDLGKYPKTSEYFLRPVIPDSPQVTFDKALRGGMIALPETVEQRHPWLAKLEDLLGYKFKDKSWLLEAITHPSYDQQNSSCIFVRSYQQLEFLGDALLDYLVVRYVYDTSSDLGPGDIALILHSVTCNSMLAEICVNRRFHVFLRGGSMALFNAIGVFYADFCERTGQTADLSNISSHNILHAGDVEDDDDDTKGREWPELDEKSDSDSDDVTTPRNAAAAAAGVRNANADDDDSDTDSELGRTDAAAPKALGDVMESLAAAVFLDCNMDMDCTWRVFAPIMQETIDTAVASAIRGDLKSPIVQLHEMNHTASFSWEPTARNIRGIYTVEVDPEKLKKTFTATADSKAAAKLAAAKKALAYLRLMDTEPAVETAMEE